MNNFEEVLRSQTLNMFSDEWYELTTKKLINIESKQKGYVYFISNKYLPGIKIGMSASMNSRMRSFLDGYSSDVLLHGFIYSENYKEIEREFHKKYEENRIKGEWFDIDSSVILKEIRENNGNCVSCFISKKTKFIDGDVFDLTKTDINYWDELFVILDGLIKDKYYLKKEIYNESIKSNAYKDLSRRKMITGIRTYCENKGLKFKQKSSNGERFFCISSL